MSRTFINQKKHTVSKKPQRKPNGLLHDWVFAYLRWWGKPAVISMEAYRQKRYEANYRPTWWNW